MAKDYHRGDVPESALDAAVRIISRDGVSSLGLRQLAREIGVAHTALLYHFGSREGLLNAIATQGHLRLAESLRRTEESTGSFLETGVAYVQFACENPAHFSVMFRPDLLDEADPQLASARAETFAVLTNGIEQLGSSGASMHEDAAAAVIAAWSLVHGMATLALTGNLDAAEVRALVADGDILAITRRAAGMLYGSPPSDPR